MLPGTVPPAAAARVLPTLAQDPRDRARRREALRAGPARRPATAPARTEPEEDLAALFEASLQATRFQRGETIKGTIVAIGPEVAFVNVGGKGEAEIEVDELRDYAERTEAAGSQTLGGSLADKLRGALEPRKK